MPAHVPSPATLSNTSFAHAPLAKAPLTDVPLAPVLLAPVLFTHASGAKSRVAIHCGGAVYRDGDYFGAVVNLTHRVVARAMAGEVLITRTVADAIGESEFLDMEAIGEVALKGFPGPVELFLATASNARNPR